jgi:hypothetical protein
MSAAKRHIDPVFPIVERSGSHVAIAWHPQHGCALWNSLLMSSLLLMAHMNWLLTKSKRVNLISGNWMCEVVMGSVCSCLITRTQLGIYLIYFVKAVKGYKDILLYNIYFDCHRCSQPSMHLFVGLLCECGLVHVEFNWTCSDLKVVHSFLVCVDI